MIGHQRSLFYQTKWSPSCATPWPSCSCGWHRAGETSLTRVSRPDKDHRGLGLKQSSSCRCGFPKGFWQHSFQFWRGLTENGWKSTTPFVHSNSFSLTIANVWWELPFSIFCHVALGMKVEKYFKIPVWRWGGKLFCRSTSQVFLLNLPKWLE